MSLSGYNPETYKRWYELNKDKKRAYARAFYSANRAEKLEYAKQQRAANPYNWRKSHRKIAYGLTCEQVEAMRLAQENKCAICADEFSEERKGKKMHIDHCHETGVVRGLLCLKCNLHLGWMEKGSIADAALKYLGRK